MNKKLLLSVMVAFSLVAIAISSIADTPATPVEVRDTNNDGLIDQTPVYTTTGGTLGGIGATIPLLTADVDLSYCGTGGIQCSLSGHTYKPVNSSNHNPIRIGILVTVNGVGVNGLNASDFAFQNPFVPAGGPSAGICGVTDCGSDSFMDAGNGQYVIFVHPIRSGVNWKAGHYFATLSVKRTLTTLISWEIPK